MNSTELYFDADAFAQAQSALPLGIDANPTAKAALVVSPDGFRVSTQTSSDNRYMRTGHAADDARARAQHTGLMRAIDRCVPVVRFRGDAASPDAVFPNNVFATINGRLIVGAMRHPERRLEARRRDIPRFFRTRLGYAEHRLDEDPACVAELTGALAIDRGRGIGYCGLSERCNEAGALAMHAAFRLRRTFVFELAAGEYHTNVVLAVLASRLVLICREAFVDPRAADAIAATYAPHVVWLDQDEKLGFSGNAIALDGDTAWLSERGAEALRPASKSAIERAGMRIGAVPLDEIETAGGSLRCCVAEVF